MAAAQSMESNACACSARVSEVLHAGKIDDTPNLTCPWQCQEQAAHCMLETSLRNTKRG